MDELSQPCIALHACRDRCDTYTTLLPHGMECLREVMIGIDRGGKESVSEFQLESIDWK